MNGNYVKNIRLKSGLSQKEFGKSIGVTGVAISNIERGNRKVTKQCEILIDLIYVKQMSDIPTSVLLEEIGKRCESAKKYGSRKEL